AHRGAARAARPPAPAGRAAERARALGAHAGLRRHARADARRARAGAARSLRSRRRSRRALRELPRRARPAPGVGRGSPPPPRGPPLDAAVRFFEGAGTRGTLELVGDELVALLRSGVPAERVALVAPALESWRAPLETVLGALDVPYAVESRVRLGATPIGH